MIITPTAEATPEERRGIALGDDEITLIAERWETCEREEADGLAVLILRGPCHRDTRAMEREHGPSGPAATAALAVVTDETGRVLLGP